MPKQPSDLERTVLFYWTALAPNYPQPVCLETSGNEISPVKGRRWKFDFAWPEQKIAIEAQGGVYMRSGHTGGKNMEDDYAKLNACVAEGWRIFYVTSGMLRNDAASFIEQVKRAFNE